MDDNPYQSPLAGATRPIKQENRLRTWALGPINRPVWLAMLLLPFLLLATLFDLALWQFLPW